MLGRPFPNLPPSYQSIIITGRPPLLSMVVSPSASFLLCLSFLLLPLLLLRLRTNSNSTPNPSVRSAGQDLCSRCAACWVFVRMPDWPYSPNFGGTTRWPDQLAGGLRELPDHAFVNCNRYTLIPTLVLANTLKPNSLVRSVINPKLKHRPILQIA